MNNTINIGQTYGLTARGMELLALINSSNKRQIPFDENTKVTVVGPFQKCTCGSKIERHTDNCPIQYIKAVLPSGDWFMACKDDLKE